jgi:hypothetical protein
MSGPDFSHLPPIPQRTPQQLASVLTEDPLREAQILRDERYRRKARQKITAEEASKGFKPFSLTKNLAEYAADGIPEPVWLIDKLCEEGANVLIQGDAKAGKSTIQMEALRCLAEKEPLFQTYTTRFLEGKIAYVDLEMGQNKTLQRLTKVNMSRSAMERILPISLAGKGFSIMNDLAYETLVNECKEHDVRIVVFDPLMHVAQKESENDCRSAQPFQGRDAGADDLRPRAHREGQPGQAGRTVDRAWSVCVERLGGSHVERLLRRREGAALVQARSKPGNASRRRRPAAQGTSGHHRGKW